MKLSEISIELARILGEEQGRSITQILADALGINNEVVHLLMIIESLAIIGIIGIIIYLIIKKVKKCSKK